MTPDDDIASAHDAANRQAPVDAPMRPPALQVEIRQPAPIPLDAMLSCGAGELLALVGPSGSGKTSILRTIAGLLMPRSGRIVCAGETWLDTGQGIAIPPQRRRVGFVFQDYALFPHLSAIANVALALNEATPADPHARARDLLRLVNLEGLEDRKPWQLSGGQGQRVALARALAREPRVLLLDEPFSAVDQMTREKLQRELVALRARLSIPIVLVTHDVDEALSLADRIAVLHHGRVLQTAAPDLIRLQPATPAVARLLGQTNIFDGRLALSATGRTVLSWGPHAIEAAEAPPAAEGRQVAWMIARDHVVLHRRGRPSHGERENPVDGIVREVTFLGERALVTLAVAGLPDAMLNFTIEAHAARRNGLAPGVQARVSLLAAGIHVFAEPAHPTG